MTLANRISRKTNYGRWRDYLYTLMKFHYDTFNMATKMKMAAIIEKRVFDKLLRSSTD